MAARPWRQKIAGKLGGKGLRLVVTRRRNELNRAAHGAVEPGDEELALGHQQHAVPVILQHLARRRLDPAEAAAVLDRGDRGLAQIFQIAAVEGLDPLDRGGGRIGAHGRQRRKLAISRKPVAWLFSG